MFLKFLSEETPDESIDGNTTKCEMLGTFGYLIQFGLGLLAFAVLFLKRCCEKPKRPWKIWWLDASKQIFSAGLAHLLNLVLSLFMSGDKVDECVFYFLNSLMDTTLGVLVTFGIMKALDCLAKAKGWKFIRSGLYYEIVDVGGDRKVVLLKLKMYFTQLGIWLIVTCLTKGIIIAIQYIFGGILVQFCALILKPFDSNGNLKLVMVMMVIPLILDAFYFWVVDNILKLNPNEADKEIQDMYIGFQEEEVVQREFNNSQDQVHQKVKKNNHNDNMNIEVQILSSK